LELVALSNEVIGWLRRYFRRLEINEETLALDLIHKIGPDGHFVDTKHTLSHVREDWCPTLFDRMDYQRWSARGAMTFQQRACQKVKEILAQHRAEPLPGNVVDSIEEIVRRRV
jgi:trimethylamine--corrinoid protein Co-methyltransferase